MNKFTFANNGGLFLCSFTHVTITDDCIEAEEYLEDSVSSAVTNDGDLAKRLFSEDDEATLSP